METDLTQGVTEYWLRLPSKYKHKLSQIRVWKTVRMVTDMDDVWVRGISPNQLNSEEIRSIPFKKIYFQHENALFLLGGNLPEERLKTALLWSPIDKALPAEMPDYNFNYFGVDEKIQFNIVPSSIERSAKAQIVDLTMLDAIIPTMPSIRLQPIEWTLLDDKALLIGTPLLSIPGKTFWQQQQFLLPTGYDFEYPELSSYFNKIINQNSNDYIIVNTDNTYYNVPKDKFKKLTISGYRLSR
ncbi:hypothetical protein H2O64_19665 [Kordia sp. YSTF-M3]|uniref:MoxR-vWA-beta-propeller ternary system domain-containing protein n=1 Tax=Kordia aestuariivivens TaxID=2759037 RepID=A0ABR7QEA8_9FLAO|nr:hypothetical protein [Kordia aestuariivivens]MBC8756901.1 hypothetical protein [Kordia aestuariivivens]